MQKILRDIITIYEDDDMIVLNKPAGVFTLPHRYNSELPSLRAYLKKKQKRVWVVHRLDGETSGVIVFAKNADAHRALSEQFAKRTVQKLYWAITDGVPNEAERVIDLSIAENPAKRGSMMIDRRGKRAWSSYRILETFRSYALLEVNIKTGRMHQIRVHLQAIGYPLAIDSIYGRKSGFMLSDVKRHYNLKKFEEEQPLMGRITLHARTLHIQHPTSGEPMSFTADLPKDFEAVLRQLRKHNSL